MTKTIVNLTASFNGNLSYLIEYPETGIINKTVIKDNNIQSNLLCLATGTEIDEHKKNRNINLTVIEGQGILKIVDQEINLSPGVFIFMPANTPHSLKVTENLALMVTFSEPAKPETKVSQKTIDIIKSTAPILKENGQEITAKMYEIMFAKYPEVKLQFNMSDQANGSQHSRLATAIYSYATHIEDLESLKAMVNKIAHRHVETHVLPEQYPIVGECLLLAIKDVLKDAITDEIILAWQEAYQLLAEVFINREHEIYNS